MKKKMMSLLLCAAMVGGLTAGCQTVMAEEKEPCEITFYTWCQSVDLAYPENMIEAFEEKYPWITVNFEMGSQSPDEYVQAQKVKFLAGDGIDVTVIRPEMREEYVNAGYLEELTGAEYLSNFSESSLKNVAVNDKIYSMPYTRDIIAVMYNKDMFAENNWEVPTCYEEWVELCGKIAEAGVTPMVNGLKDGWPLSNEIAPFMHKLVAEDPEIFNKINAGEVKYTDQIFVDTFTQIEEYFKSSAVDPSSIGFTYDQAATYFATEKAAMMCHGEWAFAPIMDAEPEFEVGVFQIPYNAKDEKQVGSISVGSSVGIASSSENKEACQLFLEFMTTPEAAQMFADGMGNFTAVEGITAKGKECWNDVAAVEESVPFYYDQMYVGASNEMYKQLQLLFIGDATVEEVLEAMQTVQEKKE